MSNAKMQEWVANGGTAFSLKQEHARLFGEAKGFIIETLRVYVSGSEEIKIASEDNDAPAIYSSRDDARSDIVSRNSKVLANVDERALYNLHQVRDVRHLGVDSEAAWAFYTLSDAAKERFVEKGYI